MLYVYYVKKMKFKIKQLSNNQITENKVQIMNLFYTMQHYIIYTLHRYSYKHS